MFGNSAPLEHITLFPEILLESPKASYTMKWGLNSELEVASNQQGYRHNRYHKAEFENARKPQ